MDTPQKAVEIKATITAAIAFVMALIGWRGVLVAVWFVAMLVDYATGSFAALANKEWSSSVARAGLWHKGGEIAIMLVAAMLDVAIYTFSESQVFGVTWNYGAAATPLVAGWYALTEMGSIIENAAKMGADFPEWLKVMVETLKAKIKGNSKEDDT